MFYPYSYQYKIIKPDTKGPISGQLESCLEQLLIASKSWQSTVYLLKVNLFFKPEGEIDCSFINRSIENSGFYSEVGVRPVIIAQSPTDGSAIQITMTGIDKSVDEEVKYHTDKSRSYVSLESDGQHWLYIGDKGCNSGNASIRDCAESSFKRLDSILEEEGLSYSNILRQWNYIPDIVCVDINENGELQNYQEFNEVRGHWYRKRNLLKDFPAATGIGTMGESVRLEIIAGATDDGYQIFSLINPTQKNAHQYSEDKLVGNIKESTPLFERGKMIFGNGKGHIWVSGTAAIKGEESISGDVIEQSNITCENIDRLIAPENLYKTGLPKSGYKINPVYVRAYVKYGKDGPKVRKYLEEKYPGALTHVLEADVCRDELLVEVEAEFSVG